MSIEYDESFKETEEMMKYVVRDPETDEITGIDPDAPQSIKERFYQYLKELDSLEPVER